MAKILRIVVVLVLSTVILAPLAAQRSVKQQSAWEALLARDPGRPTILPSTGGSGWRCAR